MAGRFLTPRATALADDGFRDDLRAALADAVPPEIARRQRLNRRIDKAGLLAWQGWLRAQGWLAPDWPRASGGEDWPPQRRFLLDEACALAGAPPVAAFGIGALGPLLQRFGTPDQREAWLPRILSGADLWCGDLTPDDRDAGGIELRRDGDDFVVTARREAVAGMRHATMIACLLRSGPGEETTLLAIDLATPGVTAQVVPMLDGSGDLARLRLDAVRVPAGNRISATGGGRDCVDFLAARGWPVLGAVAAAVAALEYLRDLAGMMHQDRARLSRNPVFAAQLAEVEADVMALRTTALRLCARPAEAADRRQRAAMLRVVERRVTRRLAELRRLVFGPWNVAFPAQACDPLPLPSGLPEAAAASRGYVASHLALLRGDDDDRLRDLIAASLLEG